MARIVGITIFIFVTRVLDAQILPVRCYTPKDGLSHTTVHSMYQDRHGFLWFGAYEAVNRFDGLSFINPIDTLDGPLNRVRRIADGGGGTIWMATHVGAVRVDPDGAVNRFGVDNGLGDDSVYDVVRDERGWIWFGTQGGLSAMDTDGVIWNYTERDGLPHSVVRRILPREDGALWIGTLGGLCVFDGVAFHDYRHEPILASASVYAMILDRNGGLWMGSDNGLIHLRPDGSVRRYDEADGLPDKSVWALLEDGGGVIWAGTDAGVAYADPTRLQAAKPFLKLNPEQDLGNTTIYSIDMDREGSIWFGTCIGIYQLVDRSLTNYRLAPTAGDVVFSISEDADNRTWFGTDQGVAVMDANGEMHKAAFDLPDPFVRAIATDAAGKMWLGTREGVLIVDGDGSRVLNHAHGLPDDYVMALLTVDDGDVYIGTLRGGVVRFDGKDMHVWDTRVGLPSNRIYSLYRDRRGSIWIGTDRGACTLSSEGVATFDGRFAESEVYDILEDGNGTYWFGTNRGLAKLEDGVLSTYGSEKGMPPGACLFLEEDDQGMLWAGTNHGVVRFDGDRFKVIDNARGLIHNEMNIGAAYKAPSGALWFGSYGGVSRVDPDLIRVNRVPPPARLIQVDVLGKNTPLGKHLTLDYNRNHIGFAFSALSFTDPRQLRFRYRLTGRDPEWRETVDRRIVYSDLTPGDYTFRVKARNADGVWSEEPASYSFTIKPPIWNQWPFRLLVLAVVAFFIFWHIRNLRLRNRMLAREARLLADRVDREVAVNLRREAEIKLLHAQMNPHFLQNAFANAIFFVKSSPDKAERVLHKLATFFRMTMNAKRSLWSTVAEDAAMAEDYLEIQQARFEDRLRYKIEYEDGLKAWRLPSLVLQPLVENAVIYGFRENLGVLTVRVCFRETETGELRVSVQNNGQPLERPFAELIREGHALSNINKRLKLLDLHTLIYEYVSGNHVFSLEVRKDFADHID